MAARSPVARFGRHRTLVVGDAVLDRYVDGTAERLSREAPVPVVTVTDQYQAPGAAANVAANVAGLGGPVELISAVGTDGAGRALLEALAAGGVGTGGVVRDRDRRTPELERVRAGGQLVVRVDRGTGTAVRRSTERALRQAVRRRVPAADAVIVSDYGRGVLTEAVLETLGELRSRVPLLVVDGKDLARLRRLRPDVVKPNWTEVVALTGGELAQAAGDRAAAVAASGRRIVDAAGAGAAAVTLDRDGAVLVDRERPPHRAFAPAAVPEDLATGAGDSFVAALALALSSGLPGPTALELATAAAAVATRDHRTVACTAAELAAALGRDGPGRAGRDDGGALGRTGLAVAGVEHAVALAP